MRRPIAFAVTLVALLSAGPAFAGAGGGSGGFGGGGGGGGGGGFSGGGGSGTGGGLFSGIFILIVIVGVLVLVVVGAIASWRLRRRRAARERQVELASVEAATDDAAFAAAAVGDAAAGLYVACQQAWDARDRKQLDQLVGGDLLVEWKRRLDDFDAKGWHNRVAVHGAPHVEYLGLVNRKGEADDRVVVRISASQDDYVETRGGGVALQDGKTTKTVAVSEWWTLSRRDGRWIVVSIEADVEGTHHLNDAIVAVPEADDERLHDESTVEVAQSDAAPAGTKTAEIADLDFAGDARAAALDLSLADGRFAPDVLEVAVRRAVAGWAEAVDGEDAPLLAVAAPDVAQRLLYPDGTATRLVVRGPRITRVRIAHLDAAADPARMDVDVEVRGRRYVENRDTADVVSGSKNVETTFTEHWTLAIDGPADNPWRIVAAK